MITLQELLNLPESDVDEMFEVLDFGEIEPYNDKNNTFDVDDIKYRCEYAISFTSSNKSVLSFKFIAVDGPNKPDRNKFDTDRQFNVALKHWGVGIIGVKHPLKALKNALSMLRNHIISKKPDYVTFTANEENRQKLYTKFFERYGHLIPRYKICDKNPLDDSSLEAEEFWLERT